MILQRRTQPELSRIFNDFFENDFYNTNRVVNTTLPAVNIIENDNEFKLILAAPGMEKKDFIINLDNNILTISSEKEISNEINEDKFLKMEYSYQSFKRSFELPQDTIKDSKIDAKYINGELILTLPKREETKPKGPLKIDIK